MWKIRRKKYVYSKEIIIVRQGTSKILTYPNCVWNISMVVAVKSIIKCMRKMFLIKKVLQWVSAWRLTIHLFQSISLLNLLSVSLSSYVLVRILWYFSWSYFIAFVCFSFCSFVLFLFSHLIFTIFQFPSFLYLSL